MKYTSKKYAAEMLDEIPGKKVALYERDKNIEFVKKYNICERDITGIIQELTINHFVERIDNKDPKIPTKYLYIFKVYLQLNNEYGEIIEFVYIKICSIEGQIILVISLHLDED